MPASQKQKFAIIDELENTRMKGSRLIISLKFARKKDEALEVRKKVRVLGGKIDDILSVAMDEWSVRGQALVDDMKRTNGLLQRDIAAIRRKKDLANAVVRALGRLDDAIIIAKDILTKI